MSMNVYGIQSSGGNSEAIIDSNDRPTRQWQPLIQQNTRT